MTLETKARAIDWAGAIYRPRDPPDDLDPNVVDVAWKEIEPHMSDTAGRFEERTDTAAEREWLMAYASMGGVHHPDFDGAINR
ncbi:hypothetical protein ACOB87_43995 [Streptomyces sp. YS-B37]|uniref:hypothetical protein n=1 Tax=Streptomyces sp. YS-B37 TaxID=3407669 RepID=UPI003B504BFE